MNNKRIIIILMIFTIIFTLMGGTFAYFNWQSADNRKTNVTFTVNRNYTCGADSGGHITSSDVRLAPAKCNDPVYAIKRTIIPSVTATGNKVVSMDLWLNINSIDTNLTNTPNFKWVFSKNVNTCESGIINQGDFRNIQNGKITLVEGAEYANNESDKYYLYIWLDESETNTNTMNQSFDFSISGNCVDNGLEKALLKNLNTTDYFREADYKTKITDISFIYDEDLPSGIITNNVKTYDLGASASRPITGYLIENTDVGADPDTYKLYVSSQYKIYAQNLASAFDTMTALKNITFDNFDTSGTTTMRNIFYKCSSLTSLDLSNFDTASVSTMYGMFDGCSGLSSVDVSYFDTSSVNNMRVMFGGCTSLTNIDLSSFDTSTVWTMFQMFTGCTGLLSLDLSYFNTSSVSQMDMMFENCASLTSLDLSNFDVSNVETMTSMFRASRNLQVLDLSSWDTSEVTNMSAMFYGWGGTMALRTIYVSESWDTSAVTDSSYMFGACSSLPNFNSSVTDKTNAYYGTGGYLTYKAYNG